MPICSRMPKNRPAPSLPAIWTPSSMEPPCTGANTLRTSSATGPICCGISMISAMPACASRWPPTTHPSGNTKNQHSRLPWRLRSTSSATVPGGYCFTTIKKWQTRRTMILPSPTGTPFTRAAAWLRRPWMYRVFPHKHKKARFRLFTDTVLFKYCLPF